MHQPNPFFNVYVFKTLELCCVVLDYYALCD